MVDNYLQRDASFQKMLQLSQMLHLQPAQQRVDGQGHLTGVNVSNLAQSQIQAKDSIDISKYLPEKWNGTRATQTELMQLILEINQESIVFRDANWKDKLAYYQQQLKTLMSGGH